MSASHSVVTDSNFARTPEPISDTINTTALKLDLDKQYGRQTYTGSAKVAAIRYGKYGNVLNNDSKDVNAGFASEFMSNWSLQLNGAYGQSLNQFENNRVTEHVVKNIRTTKSAYGQLVYGIAGIWALVGSMGKNTLGYSVPAYQYLNYRQDTQGLKAVYYSSDLLNYSLGVRKVETQLPVQDDRVHETDLDLGTEWVVTGLSRLEATVSWTHNTRELQNNRHFDGVTGRLSWNYTPHGLMSYGVNAYRSSNSDQYVVESGLLTALGIPGQVSYNNRVTSVSAFAKLAATGKLSFTAETAWNHFNIDNDVYSMTTRDASDYQSYSLGAYYAAAQWLNLSAGATQYKQTKDVTRNAYSGHAFNVAATFVLN